MNLSELLVSYNQVRSPEKETDVPDTTSNRYTRMLDFIGNKASSTPENPITEEVIQDNGWQGWTYSGNTTPTSTPTSTSSSTPTQRTNTVRAIQTGNKSAYDKFVKEFDAYLEANPHNKDTRDVLTAIAALESRYSPKAANKHSNALGYFQFLDSTRAAYNKSSREEFANDPNQQFDTAIQHYRMLQKQLSKYQDQIKNSGLSDLQVAYGMWWRPGSMLNHLRTGKDTYVNKSDGMTLEKILNRAN